MDESVFNEFSRWKNCANKDSELIKELCEIENDIEEISDRFYRNLEFGTAGMRGIIGAGTNRINVYVVGKITKAFSLYLNSIKKGGLVVIGYDNRIKSKLFAITAARVLAANNIRVKIFESLKPVPILSYAVRFLHCDGGIMITASHNPASYNGYKLYGNDGCQIVENIADKICAYLPKIDLFDGVELVDFDEGLSSGLISYCDDEIEQNFLGCVENCLIWPNKLIDSELKVVYTPLNGSGLEPIMRLMKKFRIKNFYVVEQQKEPDGKFPTCKNPNPELVEAFRLALVDCKKHKPDVAVATDPDCDRIGVAVLNKKTEDYELLNGNQLGVLMLNYICSQRLVLKNMPQKPVVYKTIVSTIMAEKIANYYGVEVENVLTGFKYIGQKIAELEKTGEQERFIFGFEESQGYLAGSYVRDKDGVFAAMLICEMVAFYKSLGKNLFDVLNELYLKFGFYSSSVNSFVFEGKNGLEKMKKIMAMLRNSDISQIGSFNILEKLDYLTSINLNLVSGSVTKIELPKSNVLQFKLENSNEVIIRVSGTEPKIKIYYHSFGCNEDELNRVSAEIKLEFLNKLKSFGLGN